MADERTTPEDELETPPTDTPEGEPAGEAESEDRPDQSESSGPIAQAEYTRATQLAASIRRELGLPKGATQAEVLEALQRVRAVPEGGDDEGEEEELDPRIAAATERAIQAELRVQRAVYGEEFAKDTMELVNAFRSSDDLEELFTIAAAFRDKHGAASNASAPGTGHTAPPADEGPSGDIDMSEGERAAARPESTPSGRRESGVVTTLRGLLSGTASGSGGPTR